MNSGFDQNADAFKSGNVLMAPSAEIDKPKLADSVIIGFWSTVAVLVIGGASGYLNAGRLFDNGKWVAHTYEVITALESLMSLIKDAETGQRGYLLTDDVSYLRPYDDAMSRITTELNRLKALTSDNGEQQARFQTLTKKIDARLAQLGQTISLAKKNDRAAAVDVVQSGIGKAVMDAIRDDIAVMQHRERNLLESRAAEAEASYRNTVVAGLLSGGIGVTLVGLLYSFAQRRIIQKQKAMFLMAEQKERLRTTLASIGDAVITTDTAGRITNMNAVAERLTGWMNRDAVGAALTEVFQIVNESTRQPVQNPAIRCLKEGVIVGLANHTILIARDGKERPIDDSAAPIRCVQGEIVGCVLVFRDIAERKLVEAQQKAAEDALREADRRKDEFLALLAHELRNPLAPIRNGLQLMRTAEGDGSTIEMCRSMMERQLTQLVRLVDDLMDVSRISQGKLELRRELLYLKDVINSAVETSRPIIEEMGHRLEVTLPDEPVVVDADMTRLAQVFMNLLTNAAKYSDPNGRIWLIAERFGSDVLVTVRDKGIGIAGDQLPSIFDMFCQLDRSLERSQGGLGIGLSLVKRLMEMHGGSIEARSEGLGRGADFVVRLPIVVATSTPLPRSDWHEETDMKSLRVLVVDDNRDGADSLAMMLRVMGNETRTASDGEQAVAAWRSFQPEVMLLDIGLPKMNGYEVCRQIRELPGGKDVVIIAQTGWGQDEDRQRTRDAGFDHHLVKPVDPVSLMKMLSDLSKLKQ